MAAAAVFSSSLSTHLDLSSKPHWQAHIPMVLLYVRTKLPGQKYVSTCSGVLQLPESSGLTAHALKCTGFSLKSNCKVQATGHDVKSRLMAYLGQQTRSNCCCYLVSNCGNFVHPCSRSYPGSLQSIDRLQNCPHLSSNVSRRLTSQR